MVRKKDFLAKNFQRDFLASGKKKDFLASDRKKEINWPVIKKRFSVLL